MKTPCQRDPDTWVSNKKDDVARAKQGCARCVVRLQCKAECLDYEALAGETKLGTYGGLSQAERNSLLMQSA
jgi:hypothetical protein